MNIDNSLPRLLLHGLPINRTANVSDAAKSALDTAKNNPVIDGGDKAARETASKFEALLLNTMLKTMRAASAGNELFDSQQADLYRDMMDQKIAEDIAASGSLGLAESIYRQLTGQAAVQPVGGGFESEMISPLTANEQAGSARFINRIRGAANRAAQSLGTSTEVILAIAALETGWGRQVASNADGSSTHNLFGIKADKSWTGAHTIARTSEYQNGITNSTKAAFRSYVNEQQSVADFANFVQQNPRYQQALSVAADDQAFVHELHRAGYATDPQYATKVLSVMQSLVGKQSG